MNNGIEIAGVGEPFDGSQARQQGEEVPVAGILHVVWRRKLLIASLSIPLIILIAALVYQLPPSYKSVAVLMIDSQRAQPFPQLSVGEAPQVDMVAVKTQVSIIQSANLASRVVEKLDLTHIPEFARELDAPKAIHRQLWDRVLGLIAGRTVDDVPLTPGERARVIAGMLLNKVTASNDGKSYLVEIAAQTSNSSLSADIANAFAATYLDFNRKLKIDAIEDANTRFFGQLPPLAEKVREADRQVQIFRVANGLTPVSGSSDMTGQGATLADQQLAQVNAQLGQAINDRTEKEAHLQQVTSALRDNAKMEAAPEIIGSSLIQSLRQRQAALKSQEASLSASTLPSNPNLLALNAAQTNIKQTINNEILKIAASVGTSARIAHDYELALQSRLSALKGVVAVQSEAQIRLRDLQNQAEAAREVYTSYLHRFQQTASLGLMQQPDAELISPAEVPLSPTGPRHLQLIGLGSVVVSGLSLFFAMMCDRLRRGFFTSQDVELATGLTVIGLVPKLRRGLERTSAKKTRILYREAISQVRATLEFGATRYRARIVLVTSALPGEGKTHFATSLARNVAAQGGRALLVECDLRRPAVARSLALAEGDHVGDCLTFDRSSQKGNLAIRHNVLPGLDVALLQTAYPETARTPSLKRARQEIEEARKNYDFIVLDGPPVLACAEAELFSGVADGAIMIVRWRSTTKGTVQSALRLLHVYGMRTVGAVLTNVDMGQLSKSGSDQGEVYRRYAGYGS